MTHYIYAAIKDNKVVNTFIIPYSEFDPYGEAQRQTVAIYGFDAFVVPVNQYPVQIGDIYDTGRFYRDVNGEIMEIQHIPTEAEEINRLKMENLSLKNQLTNAQQALVEIYEMM